jgi:hypothetical protein
MAAFAEPQNSISKIALRIAFSQVIFYVCSSNRAKKLNASGSNYSPPQVYRPLLASIAPCKAFNPALVLCK